VEVTIKFVGVFRTISGNDKIRLKFEGIPLVETAVQKIVEEKPELRDALIDPKLGNSGPNALILLNGREIGVLNELETVLSNGDEMVFIPVAHGG
jgi:molybdopterin converting factor small subunit